MRRAITLLRSHERGYQSPSARARKMGKRMNVEQCEDCRNYTVHWQRCPACDKRVCAQCWYNPCLAGGEHGDSEGGG